MQEKNGQSHEAMINKLITFHFKETPKFVQRMTMGICNEVYEAGLSHRSVIVRLNTNKKFLLGSHDHIPQFKSLNIPVPDILVEDYSKQRIPFAYQIQSKIAGKDLGDVIETLTDEQLKTIAKMIATIFCKVKTIPASHQFGVIWGGGDDEVSNTWAERMRIWIDESRECGTKTGVMDSKILLIAETLYTQYKPYFDSIKPVTYCGDINYKNVMIEHGKFNGLVDLDGLTQGDPLEAVGRIKITWYGTRHGEIYTNAVMDELGLDEQERKCVLMYGLLNKIAWTCENGIQFNQNTQAIVDKEKMQKDKAMIYAIAKELNLAH